MCHGITCRNYQSFRSRCRCEEFPELTYFALRFAASPYDDYVANHLLKRLHPTYGIFRAYLRFFYGLLHRLGYAVFVAIKSIKV